MVVEWQKGDDRLFAGFDGRRWTIHGYPPKAEGLAPYATKRLDDSLFSEEQA